VVMYGLRSKGHNARFGGDSPHIHADMEGEGVCLHDGAWQASRSLQITPLDVYGNSEGEPRVSRSV